MTDLERFFRRLVAALAASDPGRLRGPLPLVDIHQAILPYRTNRRALQLESSEDYELVLLRLCAGEGGLVRTEPEEVRARFADEVRSTNPDLGILHRYEDVLVTLRPEPVARALAPADPDLGFAPPPARPDPPPLPGLDLPAPDPLEGVPRDAGSDDEPGLAGDEPPPDAPRCLYCGDLLPTDRVARFCPHCGQRQTPPECPRCHAEVEPGWRHCVSCGAALGGGE